MGFWFDRILRPCQRKARIPISLLLSPSSPSPHFPHLLISLFFPGPHFPYLLSSRSSPAHTFPYLLISPLSPGPHFLLSLFLTLLPEPRLFPGLTLSHLPLPSSPGPHFPRGVGGDASHPTTTNEICPSPSSPTSAVLYPKIIIWSASKSPSLTPADDSQQPRHP